MKQKWILPFSIFFALILMPISVFADDFSISDVEIKALLQENGTVQVTETHTYVFEDDFNGLTRELIPKEGTSIDGFQAFENGRKLDVERDDNLYKVHRPADDETVTVELLYTINGAIVSYEDGAQFYWPFFSDDNETDYENMTITITPPAPADEAEFLGYDEAFETGQLESDGTVVFALGHVPSGKNGDIRVIYENDLFTGLATANGTVRDAIRQDREDAVEDAIAFEQNQSTAQSFGSVAVPVGGASLLGLFGILFGRSRKIKREALETKNGTPVVNDELSIPAALYFSHSPFLNANTLAAAMMELIRKGYVLQHSEKEFELLSSKTEYPHEKVLLDFLFNEVGKGKILHLDQLERYSENEKVQPVYMQAVSEHGKLVAEEVKEQHMYDKSPIIRWSAAFVGLLFGGVAIYTGIYGLEMWMALSLFITMAAAIFAAFYSPMTVKGHRIKQQWKHLKAAMDDLPEEVWNSWSSDEKQRAYAYYVGTGAAESSGTMHAFRTQEQYGSLAFDPVFMMLIFVAANNNTGTASAASSASVGGGGGIGGGGGGSGAF